jgi:hypothetical protein
MSSAYIIANVTVTDPQQYEQYKKWSSAAIQAHGAEVCVRAWRQCRGGTALQRLARVWPRPRVTPGCGRDANGAGRRCLTCSFL